MSNEEIRDLFRSQFRDDLNARVAVDCSQGFEDSDELCDADMTKLDGEPEVRSASIDEIVEADDYKTIVGSLEIAAEVIGVSQFIDDVTDDSEDYDDGIGFIDDEDDDNSEDEDADTDDTDDDDDIPDDSLDLGDVTEEDLDDISEDDLFNVDGTDDASELGSVTRATILMNYSFEISKSKKDGIYTLDSLTYED